DAARQSCAPPSWKGADVALQQEAELAQWLRISTSHMQAQTPKHVADAYEKLWGPSLIDRAARLGADMRGPLAGARALGRSVDSTLAALTTSGAETRLAARADTLERRGRRLVQADRELRTSVAHGAVTRALAALADEREGIDYGLAAAAY